MNLNLYHQSSGSHDSITVQSFKTYCLNSVCQVNGDPLRVKVEWPLSGGALFEVDCGLWSNEVAALLVGRDWLRVLCLQWKSVLKELIGVSTHANSGSIPVCKTGMRHSVQVAQRRMNESNCQSNRQSQKD